MDPEIAQRFRGYLGSRETIRWTGRPIQGFTFQHGDLITAPFAVVWAAIVVIMISGFTWDRPSEFLFATIFLVLGFNFVFGRYLTDAYVRTKTYYALSDQRALILSGWDGRRFTAVEINGVSEINIMPGDGDRGTIVFGPPNDTLFFPKRGPDRSISPEFFKIEQAQAVYALVQSRRGIGSA